ncbi:MAG: hypothetical protein ACOCVW_02935 [bacterium]
MIVYLTDRQEVARALRAAPAGGAEETRIEVLPERLLAAASTTGRLIGELAPELVAICALLPEGADRAGVVYRIRVGGDAWVADVPFDHDAPALNLCAPGEGCAAAEEPVGRAAAGAFAAALVALPPARVIGVAGGEAAVDRVVDLATTSLGRALEAARKAAARSSGGDAVSESVRIGGTVAERLRLTATQRARFLQAVRSAAARSGRVPSPVETESDHPAVNKAEAKRRLAELERRLSEWERAEE